MTGLTIIDNTAQKTHEWLKAIADELNLPHQKAAYAALRATLHALRDCLSTDEVAQLGAQLPTLIRGIFYEGWNPHPGARRSRDRDAFLDSIGRETKDHPELPDAEAVARGVLTVLTDKVSAGEIAQIVGQLPRSVREIWTNGVY